MEALRKITVNLPATLLDDNMRRTGKGLTETLREALEAQARTVAWDDLLALRGKVKFGATWQELAGKYEE